MPYSLGLLRAQHTYQLPITDLANGKIKNKITHAYLTAADCLFIATERLYGNNPMLSQLSQLFQSGGVDYAIAIEWAEAALQ